MYRAGAYYNTKDYPRAIADYGAMIEAARGRTAYIELVGLFLRGSVYSELGTYDLALRDLKAALAMSDGNLADIVRGQINEVKKEMARSGVAPPSATAPALGSASSHAETVMLCPGDPSTRLQIDAAGAAVVETIQGISALGPTTCTYSYVNGRTGPVADEQSCPMLGGSIGRALGTQIVRQYVKISGSEVEWGVIPVDAQFTEEAGESFDMESRVYTDAKMQDHRCRRSVAQD